MSVPRDIAPQEELGRGVFSRRHAARARRSRIPLNVFLERPGQTDLSVDRLGFASAEQAAENGDRVAAARGSTFYGWAVVTAENAGGNGRRVASSPLTDNPYHADISLPNLAAEDREEQKRHAQELADVSRWRARSDSHEE